MNTTRPSLMKALFFRLVIYIQRLNKSYLRRGVKKNYEPGLERIPGKK